MVQGFTSNTKRIHFIIRIVAVILFSIPASAQVKKKGPTEADTFKTINNYIAKKKFGKANRLLKKFNKARPKHLNGLWVQAQVNLYAGNYRRSRKLYEAAMLVAPKNDYLKLNYIHSLADMGKTDRAESMLSDMEKMGRKYTDMTLLHARLYYYEGDFNKADGSVKNAAQRDWQKQEVWDLNDMIELARAPRLSLNVDYLSDNQPLTILNSNVKLEKYFSKYFSLTLNCDYYHFLQTTPSDVPWVWVGNKMYFDKIGLHLTYGAGVMQFPAGNKTSWTGKFEADKKISQHVDLDLNAQHVPYFGTKASVDTSLTVTQLSATLNIHKNNWQVQMAYLNSQYPDNNNVYTAYAWFLAPIAVFPAGVLQMGLSASYNNSDNNMYVPVNSLASIIANYYNNEGIAGVYSPYFTPNNEYIGEVLLSLNVKVSKKVSLYINGDIGYGSILNPYLYLNNGPQGSIVLDRNFSMENFVPYDASVTLNYHVSKTWFITGKYAYRSTYFFNSNNATLGIQKSFEHHKKSA